MAAPAAAPTRIAAPPQQHHAPNTLPGALTARHHKSMNDETSALPESQAGADTPPPATPPAPAAPAAFGFGAAKGSGLMRGKRQTPPAAPAAASSQPTEAYIPTAIQIVEPERETFGGFGAKPEAHAPEIAKHTDSRPEVPRQHIAARAPEPVAPVRERPTPAAESIETQEPAITNKPVETAPTTVDVESAKESDAPAELNILPTEPRKVQEHRWDHSSDSESRRGDSRGEDSRREGRQGGRQGDRGYNRGPGQPGGRDFRRDSRSEDRREGQRPSQPSPMPTAPEASAKSGGLLGWIKGLFTSKPAAPAARTGGSPEHDGEHRGGRRRRGRGRRGRGGDFQGRGPQEAGPGGERRFEGGQGSGERRFEGGHGGGEGGGNRRRGRGGRGRGSRGRGGDYRGGEDQGVRGGGGI